MVVVIEKVNLQINLCFFLIVVLFVVMSMLSSISLHQNTRPINRPSPQTRIQYEEISSSHWILVWGLGLSMGLGPSILIISMILIEGVGEQHEHNKRNSDKEENKGGWFAIFTFTITTTICC